MRLQRLESFRIYSMMLIVFAHSQLLIASDRNPLASRAITLCLATLARFTMPFFLILSGYFVGGKILKHPAKARSIAFDYTLKILCLHLFWGGAYTVSLLLRNRGWTYDSVEAVYSEIVSCMSDHPIRFFMGGPYLHLWFLSALVLIIWCFVLFAITNKSRAFLYMGILLYAAGLFFGPYNFWSVGIDIDNKPEYYVVYSILFFSVGVELEKKSATISKPRSLLIAFLGFAIYSGEVYFRWRHFAADPLKNDFLLGMIPFGIGVFLFALRKPYSDIDNLLGPCGRFVLGIYLIHVIFIDYFSPLGDYFQPVLWQFLLPLLSFSSSVLTVYLLSKTRLRYVVGIGDDAQKA